MEEQKEIENMNQAQQSLWLVNNILFSYEGETHTSTYTDGSKSTGRKVGFPVVFMDFTRRNIHPHSCNDSNKNNMR